MAAHAAAAPTAAPAWAARLGSPSVALFLSLFASQAAVLVLSPVLVDVARDLDVSTALAGQLRLLGAPLAAAVAIAVVRAPRRLPLRNLLLAGNGLILVGALASAAAPTFGLLAVAQIPTWVGSAVLVAAGIGAAGSWGPAESRTRIVARALAGPPAAWVVGMPLVGLVAEVHWRLAFLVLPLPAAVLAVAALLARASDGGEARRCASITRLLREPGARGWLAGELFAISAWAGTLVFSGALLVERYGVSPLGAGIVLGVVAVAFLGGNAHAQRVDGARTEKALAASNLAGAAGVLALWTVTPHAAVTIALFFIAAYVVAARSLWATTHGFAVAGGRRLEAGAARAAATQVGYLVGSAAGGAALALGGFPLVGVVFGALFVAAAVPHLRAPAERRAPAPIAEPATVRA